MGGCRFRFPTSFKHFAVGGGNHSYKTDALQCVAYSPIGSFQLPVTPLLPIDSHFDDNAPEDQQIPVGRKLTRPDLTLTLAPLPPPSPSRSLQIWRASSGHLLVRPKINGSDAGGFMVVDTGASGFVIGPKAAIALGMDAFGELFAASISGKVRMEGVGMGREETVFWLWKQSSPGVSLATY